MSTPTQHRVASHFPTPNKIIFQHQDSVIFQYQKQFGGVRRTHKQNDSKQIWLMTARWHLPSSPCHQLCKKRDHEGMRLQHKRHFFHLWTESTPVAHPLWSQMAVSPEREPGGKLEDKTIESRMVMNNQWRKSNVVIAKITLSSYSWLSPEVCSKVGTWVKVKRQEILELLNGETFTHRGFYADKLLHRAASRHKTLHRNLYTEQFLLAETLHKGTFTHRRSYTQKPSRTKVFTQKHFCTRKVLHADASTQNSTQRNLRTEKHLHTQTFLRRNL